VDAIDLLILLLRLALVAALYGFLVIVVRAAWRGLQAPREAAPSRPVAAPALLRLLVIEPGESDLPAGAVIEVGAGATFGRAERSSVLVADPAVSAEHARLDRQQGSWVIADLGSTNGTLLNQALVDGQAALGPGDVLGLGTVRLKVVGR
jgi:Inner membrane component of T3SS, cytoplasmic domain